MWPDPRFLLLKQRQWQNLQAQKQRTQMLAQHQAHFEWLQQEKSRLKREEATLDTEKLHLENERRRLELWDRSLGETPAQHEKDSFNSAVDGYNRRVAAFQSSVNQHDHKIGIWKQEAERYNANRALQSR